MTFAKTLLATTLTTLALPIFAATPTPPNPPVPPVSPAQRAQIEQVVHQYLVQHPEVLMEAAQALQQQQLNQEQQIVKQTQQVAPKFANALFHQANDPIAGNPNGKVALVEFFDYQCPHCVDLAPVVASLIKANPDLRVIYKDFPIRGPMSDLAARAAVAANMQGKYDAFSHALLTTNQPLTQDSIFKIAKDNGINVDQLKKDMNNPKVLDQIKANLALAQNLKLFGTPALFIAGPNGQNGKGTISYMPGQFPQDQLQAAIKQAAQS